MKSRYFTILGILLSLQLALGQTFNSQSASQAMANGTQYTYFSNGITVSNLGNLDGISLGVESLEINLTVSSVFGIQGSVVLYLVAPNGNLGTLIMLNTLTAGSNKTYVFNHVSGNPTIKNRDPAPIGTYTPYGNFNSLNLGQSANGVWRLYARQKNLIATVTINSWKITFGNSGLSPGAVNQNFANALPLINTTSEGRSVIGSNKFNGIVAGDSKGPDVGDYEENSTRQTETSVWYSFIPKCKNDKIEIMGNDGYISSAILNSSRTVIQTKLPSINQLITYENLNFNAGSTYYLAMDADEADFFRYDIKWHEGDVGCSQLPVIVTSNQAVTNYCPGSSININYTASGTFNTGNRFTAQLSDVNGSFANPAVIGYTDIVSANTILATLPSNLSAGNYLIRVVSSNPVAIGSANAGVNIIANPQVPLNITGKDVVCENEQNILYTTSPLQSGTRFRWKSLGGAQIKANNASDSSSVLVNFGTSGSQISVQAVNQCGVSSAIQKVISVNTRLYPSAVISTQKPTLCQGDSALFESTYTNQGQNPAFEWKVNNIRYGTSSPVQKIKGLKNKDTVSLTLTSSETCVTTQQIASNKITLTVSDTVNPTVVIAGTNSICKGKNAEFKAVTGNSGINPVFKWYINNRLQNNNSNIFSSDVFKNNDSIWVELTSDAVCAKPAVVVSAKLKLIVADTVKPVVSIFNNDQICKGTFTTFKARFLNGGTSPAFSWHLNNTDLSISDSIYTTNMINQNDSLWVTLFSDASCSFPAQANSLKTIINVTEAVLPKAEITGNKQICQGSALTLKAETQNAGSNPAFKWYVNNVLQNIAGNTFTAKFKNNDSIKTEITSDMACANPRKVFSQEIITQIRDTIIPVVSLAAPVNSVCAGSETSFYANTVNGGKNPLFEWYLNNVLQITSDSVLIVKNPKNNDSLWVKMQSDAVCASVKKAVSSNVFIQVTDTVIPAVNITGPDYFCIGQNIYLEAKGMNAGNNTAYTWLVNGVNQNVLTSTLSGKSFKNGDSVVAILNSNLPCAFPKTISSVPYKVVLHDTLKPLITLLSDTVYCSGEPGNISSQILHGGQRPEFIWTENNVLLQNEGSNFNKTLPAGTHTITATLKSNERCLSQDRAQSSITFTIRDSYILKPVITGDTVLCDNSMARFIYSNPAIGQVKYNWIRNGLATGISESVYIINNLNNGETIALDITGNEKCISYLNSNVLTVKITATATPEVIITASDSSICPDEQYILKTQVVNPGLNDSYTWLKGTETIDYTDSVVISVSSPSEIKLLYSTTLPCGIFSNIYTAPRVRIKDPAPVLTSIKTPDHYCIQDASVTFITDLIPNASYRWTYPSALQAEVKNHILVLNLQGSNSVDSLKVTASNECGSGEEIFVLIDPKDCSDLFIPNAIISSDTHGNNLWNIRGIENYPDVHVLVFNRWGNQIFSSQGYHMPWNGTISGKTLPSGTYYYVIEGVKSQPLTGSLTIIN